MNTIEERILAYPHASAEDRRYVEAYVDEHPEWKPLFRDVQSFESLADAASVFETAPTGDDVLATYVVARRLGSVPSSLEAVFDRLESRIDADADLQRRVDAIERRIASTESALDPESHFERVTGYSLGTSDETTETPADASADRPPMHEGSTNERSRDGATASDRRASDRAASDRAASGSSRSLLARLGTPVGAGLAAVMLLAFAYGGLYTYSEASQSTMQRLAAVQLNEDVARSYDVRTRSFESESERQTTDDLYLGALNVLDQARTSTLGLFPRYDEEKLSDAEDRLQRVLEQTNSRSFLHLEARFYLGKVNLAQGDLETARTHLKTVVREEGRRAQDALDILKTLQKEYPAAPPSGGPSL